MGKGRIIAASLLIIASIAVYTQVDETQIVTVQEELNFSNSYPYNDTWEDNGTHFQTETDSNGYLVLANTSENANGVFESNNQVFNGSLEIERFTAKADTIKKDKHEANVTFYALDREGAVVSSKEFVLTEKSRLYNLNFSEKYYGYSYDIELETTDTTTPKVESLNLEGVENVETSETYGFKLLAVVLFALVGVAIGLSG